MAKKNDNKLEKAVNAIVTRLEKAETFVLEQAPDVCKEVSAEKRALTAYCIAICTAASAGFIRLGFFLASFAEVSRHDDVWPYVTATLAGLLACILAVAALVEVSSFISLKTAPKLTILRELKSLTESNEE